MRIGVIFGGPSPEHDISVLTGLQAARLLASDHDVKGLYWAFAGSWHLVSPSEEAAGFLNGPPASSSPAVLSSDGFALSRRGKLRPIPLDAVIVCCHGGLGEDGSLQGLLRVTGIPTAGPSLVGAAVGQDKWTQAELARAAGVKTNQRLLLTPEVVELPFDGPWIVKPRFGGSSLGIEVINDIETGIQLLAASPHFSAGAVIEPFLDGWTDLNLSVRTHPKVELSEIERPLRSGDVYDYAEKYLGSSDSPGLDLAPRELPATLPEAVAKGIRSASHALVPALSVRGVARLDFLWAGDDRVIFNEINTIPGSLSLYLWEPSGVARRRILADLIDEALKTSEPPPVRPDGTALRAAGSIAGKLG